MTLAAGLITPGAASAAAPSQTPRTINIVGTDYHFALSTHTPHAGLVAVHFRAAGQSEHQAEVARLRPGRRCSNSLLTSAPATRPPPSATQRAVLLVGQVTGQMAGTLGVGLTPPPQIGWWLFDIEVVPEHRRRGYGGLLLEAAEREVRSRGGDPLGLNVLVGKPSRADCTKPRATRSRRWGCVNGFVRPPEPPRARAQRGPVSATADQSRLPRPYRSFNSRRSDSLLRLPYGKK
jgi:GNAT superfamily N-acetyltransferase